MNLLNRSITSVVIILCLLVATLANAQPYTLRKYEHVKSFYQSIAKSSLELGMEQNVPPAAILAMAGLESGYGDGYVSRITGNILSLGARKDEPELPPLYLPTHLPSNTVLIDETKIQQTPKSELLWKKRPPSLKKDYRPKAFAGKDKNLAILQQKPQLQVEARKNNINDFVSSWISYKSVVPVFVDTRKWLDDSVKAKGKKVLLSCDTARDFIRRIGGKPRSFNHRESWVKKVNYILDYAGLCELTTQMAQNKEFQEAWEQSKAKN